MTGCCRHGGPKGLPNITVACGLLAASAGFVVASGARKAALRVETAPPGALVSVRHASQAETNDARQVAGTTPLEKVFDFEAQRRLWLEVELRGYAPKTVEVTPESGTVSVALDRIRRKDGSDAPVYVAPALHAVVLAGPEVRVTLRHFATEEVSAEQGAQLRDTLAAAIRAHCKDRFDVATLRDAAGADQEQAEKALWRDARTAMELLDPIRLTFFAEAPTLETRSGRDAARTLGERLGADAILVISGRQTVETGGMKAGKVALMAAGTAASYAAGYSAAMARGDSVFAYSVFIPAFAQGLLLQAALVRCSDGEVLWLNKGVWPPLGPGDPAAARVAKELLAGLP